jgi:hypothetical protein
LRPPKKTLRDGGCCLSVDELLSTKVVHLVSGELQLSVGGHHLGVSAGIRRTILSGLVLDAVDLQHDASPAGSSMRKSIRCRRSVAPARRV